MTLDIDMAGFTLTNGATWVDGTTDTIVMNVGVAGTVEGLTQFSGQYLVSQIEQDGVQFGSFTSVQIDEFGIVTAIFDNGRTLPIFQVPLATFANPNGLLAQSGNVYIETTQSGQYFLRAPITGGAGQIEGGALEASTVDLATEFTDMIITQRAYSASAKIITTADEMLDELVRIKR
jgi:flagellar hook protein FlgE